jgi:16S rRNA (cytosine967-C5)-methyltransferase
MIAPARKAAYKTLLAIAETPTDLPSALAVNRTELRDDRDQALATEIATGTLRWQLSLDHIIEHLAGRPLRKLDGEILIILRMSLYQLLHLDRVPAAAVVDDAVKLSRAARKPSASGFVNATLRSALRRRGHLPLPPRPEDRSSREADLAYLSITHSHPEWLAARWLDRHGFAAAEQWVRFSNIAPHMTLRVNRLRSTVEEAAHALSREGVSTEPTRFAPDGLTVVSGNPFRSQMKGLFMAQDEASQLVPLLVGARPGECVLDLCASPGGKTIALASEMADSGTIVASDVRYRRIRLLRDTIRTSGAKHVHLVHVDSGGALPFRAVFDRILIDAPCSGLGTIRRDPDIRWSRHESDLTLFAQRQELLLHRAAEVVKPGGTLVYATCSSEPEENEGVIDSFVSRQQDFEPLDLRLSVGETLAPLIDARGMFRTLPFIHGLEAFFAAALKRRALAR